MLLSADDEKGQVSDSCGRKICEKQRPMIVVTNPPSLLPYGWPQSTRPIELDFSKVVIFWPETTPSSELLS